MSEAHNDLGEEWRLHFGIDGTPGDAQDRPHPFVGKSACYACGLSLSAKCHTGISSAIGDKPCCNCSRPSLGIYDNEFQ